MKKMLGRCLSLMLILALNLVLCPIMEARAQEDISVYTMDGTVITGYNGAGGDIILPATATGIGDYAFAGNGNISSVTVPANITSVGSYSFSGCTGLGSVVFGGPVSLGTGVFCH